MRSVAILEAGSTVTKSYTWRDGAIRDVGLSGIEFKRNYGKLGHISNEDLSALLSCARKGLDLAPEVHVYGTSIFRQISKEDQARVGSALAELGNVHFHVVSAAAESHLTCIGAIQRIVYPGSIGVMVGGGGSVETAVFRDGHLVAVGDYEFGVGDINSQFPDLTEEIARTPMAEVIEWIVERISPPVGAADLLVLAGGNFPLLYENAGYPLRSNAYSSDPGKKYMMTKAGKLEQDYALFYELRLSHFRHLTPEAPAWWDGTRAMCCLVDAVAEQLGAEILIPTKISMVYGIAANFDSGSSDGLNPRWS